MISAVPLSRNSEDVPIPRLRTGMYASPFMLNFGYRSDGRSAAMLFELAHLERNTWTGAGGAGRTISWAS